jgi:hypothetical protein
MIYSVQLTGRGVSSRLQHDPGISSAKSALVYQALMKDELGDE